MAFVPERLVEARKALSEHGRSVSQGRFAALVGVSARSPERWEAGASEPRMAQLAKIAEVTGRPIGFFFDAPSDAISSDQRELFADLLRRLSEALGEAAESVLRETKAAA